MSNVLALHPYLPVAELPVLDVQKKIYDERLFIAAPPEVIWTFLTHPDAIPLWNEAVEDVSLYQWYSDAESDVVGAVRTLYLEGREGTIQTQVITDWQPTHTLGYTTVEGLQLGDFTADLHVGLFKLYGSADGTEIQWLNYVEFEESPQNPLSLYRLGKQFHQTLVYLKWQVEKAYALSETAF